MTAFSITTLALSGLLCVQDTRPDTPPDPARVTRTCEALKESLTKGTPEEAVAALHEAKDILHPDVIASIDKYGLRHKDLSVRTKAIEALGRMGHDNALKALHKLDKRDKKLLRDEPVLYATLLREIARHGSESSIDILTRDLFGVRDKNVTRTRILGLGKIRSKKSVDELIQLMRSTRAGRANDHFADFRLSLVALTGVDKGENSEYWINWYGDQKRSLKIAPRMAPLPKTLDRRWKQFWDESEARGRNKDGERKKGDRKKRK